MCPFTSQRARCWSAGQSIGLWRRVPRGGPAGGLASARLGAGGQTLALGGAVSSAVKEEPGGRGRPSFHRLTLMSIPLCSRHPVRHISFNSHSLITAHVPYERVVRNADLDNFATHRRSALGAGVGLSV